MDENLSRLLLAASIVIDYVVTRYFKINKNLNLETAKWNKPAIEVFMLK